MSYHPVMSNAASPASPARARPAGQSQLVVDLGPVLVFVAAFNILLRFEATKENAVYWATALFMAAIAAAIVYSKVRYNRVTPVLIVTGVLVVAFGGLTLITRDPTYIQLKPTITYGFYTVAILGSLAAGHNIWKLLFQHAFNLPDRIWIVLALRWAGFFIVMALLNEYVRATQTFEFWVNSRPFLAFPPALVFAALNTPLVLKHHRDDEEAPNAPRELGDLG